MQQVTWIQSHSERLIVTAPEHRWEDYLEEEEERGGSLGLGVTAQGYGRLAGGGGTQWVAWTPSNCTGTLGSCPEEEACGGSLGLRAIVRGSRWLLTGGAA